MEPATSPSILAEVRDFLSSLKNEWPEVFIPIKRAKPEAPTPVVVAVVLPAGHTPFVAVPSVDVNAAVKPALPEGDLVSHFRARADYWAPYLGVTFNRLSVKDQRTLWGSCAREGNLNFSWRLALAPDPVLDYLVVHELAHRAQMNHSRRFWEVVERVCPDHRSHRRWLRKNGAALYAVRR